MKFLKVILLFSLVGCATEIDFYVPAQRFQTPETNGAGGKFDFSVGQTKSQKISTARVSDPVLFGNNVTLDTATEFNHEKHIATTFSVGLGSQFDIFALGYLDGPSYYGFKFQLLGNSGTKKSDGLKLAVTGSFAYMEEEGNTTKVTVNNNSREYESTLDVQGYDASVILGYRFNPGFIAYVSGGYSQLSSESVLTSNQFDTVNIKGDVLMTSGTFGIKVGGNNKIKTFACLEATYNKVEFKGALADEKTSIGGVLGYSF